MKRMIANGLKPQYFRNICHICPVYGVSEGLRVIGTDESLRMSDPPPSLLNPGIKHDCHNVIFH